MQQGMFNKNGYQKMKYSMINSQMQAILDHNICLIFPLNSLQNTI